MNGIQLEMNFEGPRGNRFREKMNNGVFQVLVEVNPPPDSMPVEDAAARYADIEYAVCAREDLPSALVFTDHSSAPENGMNPVRFASALCKMDRDKHLICLSGRSRTLEEVEKLARQVSAEGFRNVLLLSGGSVAGDTVRNAYERNYTESLHSLTRIREDFSDLLFAGCAANPFCYMPETAFPQYFKLVKKINAGASFVVSQFGWDMAKLQEMRWYLSSRNLHVPSIARMLLLTPERAEMVCSGKIPGIHISADMEAMLRREMSYSMAQFEAAQLRRLQIHAAGALFFGYSGIQLSGIERVEQVEIILTRIAEALKEFSSFEDWYNAYRDYYARLELAPYPYCFYVFENLLSSAMLPVSPVMTQSDIELPGGWERFQYCAGKKLFPKADVLPASEKRLTKKILFGCHSCPECRLPKTHYICPENCPRGMSNGPCGEINTDGSCVYNDRECIHVKRMRIASSINDFSSMEEVTIPPLEK